MILNGLRYHVEAFGQGDPLLLLHGFTGNVRSWAGLAATLGRRRDGETIAGGLGRRGIAVDLPGHGRTELSPDPARYRMESVTADLIALLDALEIARADVLGYSMGGRVALHLALAAPGRVGRVVLESASPGIADEVERAARRAADEALAHRLEKEGLEAFITYWNALPLFAGRQSLPTSVREDLRRQQLAGSAAGLAASLRGMGAGVPEPLWERLGEIEEALIVVGEQDEKYVEIGRRMAAVMTQATLAIIPGAGHTPHLERPDAFGDLVERYLNTPPTDTGGNGIGPAHAGDGDGCGGHDADGRSGQDRASPTPTPWNIVGDANQERTALHGR